MNVPDNLSENILAGLDELKQSKPELEKILDHYAFVLDAQRDVRESFLPALSDEEVAACRQRAADGSPLLRPEDVRIDWDLFDGLVERLAQASREHAGADLRLWPADTPDDRGRRDKMLRGVMSDIGLLTSLAAEAGVDTEPFIFLACQAVTPFLEAYAEQLRSCVDESWAEGCCPVCGGMPLMGVLDADAGKKLLQCHLCRTQWPFKRVQCPSCDSTDQNQLRFFYDEQDPAWRVEVCDDCKSYLKVVDARKLGRPAILLVEDLASLHLDMVAEQDGFRGKGPAGWKK